MAPSLPSAAAALALALALFVTPLAPLAPVLPAACCQHNALPNMDPPSEAGNMPTTTRSSTSVR